LRTLDFVFGVTRGAPSECLFINGDQGKLRLP
jgi:hypothetical protein